MSNITESLETVLSIDGALGCALGDWNTGFALGNASKDSKFNSEKLEQAIALNSEVIKAKNKARDLLGIDSNIEDILITLDDQYHLIRVAKTVEGMFFYMALDREKANLGLARMKLQAVEKELQV